MGQENKIKFESNWADNKNKVKAYMIFEICDHFEDGNYEKKLEVGCYEDIEMYFSLYLQKNWDELFDEGLGKSRVADAEFKGITFVARKEDNDDMVYAEITNKCKATVQFDAEKADAMNAKKN